MSLLTNVITFNMDNLGNIPTQERQPIRPLNDLTNRIKLVSQAFSPSTLVKISFKISNQLGADRFTPERSMVLDKLEPNGDTWFYDIPSPVLAGASGNELGVQIRGIAIIDSGEADLDFNLYLGTLGSIASQATINETPVSPANGVWFECIEDNYFDVTTELSFNSGDILVFNTTSQEYETPTLTEQSFAGQLVTLNVEKGIITNANDAINDIDELTILGDNVASNTADLNALATKGFLSRSVASILVPGVDAEIPTSKAVADHVEEQNATLLTNRVIVVSVLTVDVDLQNYISNTNVLNNTDQIGSADDIILTDVSTNTVVTNFTLLDANIVEIEFDKFDITNPTVPLPVGIYSNLSWNGTSFLRIFDTNNIPNATEFQDGLMSKEQFISVRDDLDIRIANSTEGLGIEGGFVLLDSNGELPISLNLKSVKDNHRYADDVNVLFGAINGDLPNDLGLDDINIGLVFICDSNNFVSANANNQTFNIDDEATWIGSRFLKQDNTTEVTSVNNQVGNVTITKADVGLGNVDNTSDLDKPISNATQSKFDSVQNDIDGKLDDTQLKTTFTDSDTDLASNKLIKDNLDLKVDNTQIVQDLTAPTTTDLLSASGAKTEFDLKADLTVISIMNSIRGPLPTVVNTVNNDVQIGACSLIFNVPDPADETIPPRNIPLLVEFTGDTITINVVSGFQTHLDFSFDGVNITVNQSNSFLSNNARYTNIGFSVVQHFDKTNVGNIIIGGYGSEQTEWHSISQETDVVKVLNGLDYGGNSGVLTLNRTSGSIYGPGAGGDNRDVLSVTGDTLTNFGIIFRDGSGSWTFDDNSGSFYTDLRTVVGGTDFPVDDGTGVIASISATTSRAFNYQLVISPNGSNGVDTWLILPHSDIQPPTGYADIGVALNALSNGEAQFDNTINALVDFLGFQQVATIARNATDFGDIYSTTNTAGSIRFSLVGNLGLVQTGAGAVDTDDVENVSNFAHPAGLNNLSDVLEATSDHVGALDEIISSILTLTVGQDTLTYADVRSLVNNNIKVYQGGILLLSTEFTVNLGLKQVILNEVITQVEIDTNLDTFIIISGGRKVT